MESKFFETTKSLLQNRNIKELIDAKDRRGNSALYYALLEKKISLAILLINKGASLTQPNQDNTSALDLAKKITSQRLTDCIQKHLNETKQEQS